MRAWYGAFVGSLVLAVFGLVLGGRTTDARAQAAEAPLDAAAVVGLVQSFYDQTTTFEAEFHQTQFTKIYNRTERANGRVVFKKPGMMRFDYAQPNGQVFVCDGRTLQIYQPPDEGESAGQLIERPVQSDQLPAAFGFLMGTGRLDRDFTVRLLDPQREGFPGGYVLELRPRQASPHYDRLLFFVQVVTEQGRRAGVLRRVLIVDAAGNRNRFDFQRPQFNRQVPASRFRYTPPRGTRRVRP
ncbi:MAG: outer membrane lipoprotein carrier protein LolA [Polyangiales bacterium]